MEYPVVDNIKSLRLEIAKATQLAQKYKEVHGSEMGREISLVITKLQEAKMWAGKCLEVIGNTLPEEFRDEPK